MKLNYKILGSGDHAIIVETALGSTFVEWIPILKPLSEKYLIFLYDRAGYGKSDETESDRSPKYISLQLRELINQTIPGKKYLFIGHSIGGLYVQQYIRDYPTNVIGAVFLDPATTEETRFKTSLTQREFKRSGIDKSFMIRQGVFLGRLRLLRLLRPLFKKSIPFYYYEYDIAEKKEILRHMTQYKTYKAMQGEYAAYQKQNEIFSQLIVHDFPQIPIRVLYHNPEMMVNEIIKFGGLTEDEAYKIDNLWKEIIVQHYSKLSKDFKLEIAENSGHYIHLTDKVKLYDAVDEIITPHNK